MDGWMNWQRYVLDGEMNKQIDRQATDKGDKSYLSP